MREKERAQGYADQTSEDGYRKKNSMKKNRGRDKYEIEADGVKEKPSRRKEDYKQKLWISVEGLRNVPENCAFTALKCYLCSDRGQKVD